MTVSIPTKIPNQIKIRNAGVMRMIHCKIFQSGWTRSQTTWRMQKPVRLHKFLKTQIQERTTKVAEKSRKHMIFTRFSMPKLRRIGEALPRADKFGADHKILNEECESRNNHRFAVVVQDLATQWIQSNPSKKTRLHRKQEKWQRSFTHTNLRNLAEYTIFARITGTSCGWRFSQATRVISASV